MNWDATTVVISRRLLESGPCDIRNRVTSITMVMSTFALQVDMWWLVYIVVNSLWLAATSLHQGRSRKGVHASWNGLEQKITPLAWLARELCIRRSALWASQQKWHVAVHHFSSTALNWWWAQTLQTRCNELALKNMGYAGYTAVTMALLWSISGSRPWKIGQTSLYALTRRAFWHLNYAVTEPERRTALKLFLWSRLIAGFDLPSPGVPNVESMMCHQIQPDAFQTA